jgi:Flp pilus assembly protein TadD
MSRVATAWAALCLSACSADRIAERGREALDDHDLASAEAQFRRALGKEPVHAGALAGLGWTYLLAGERPAARDAFARCREVAPQEAECLRGYASIAMAEGQVDGARRYLDQARSLAPDDPHVESSAALLQMVAGDTDGAAERFQRLVDRLPDDGEYRLGLGEARLRQRRTTEAMNHARAGATADNTPRRSVALLWELYARAAVQATDGLQDSERCDEALPAVQQWLSAADDALDQAQSAGVGLPNLPATRRLVARRRSMVEDNCPTVAPVLPPGEG